MRAGASSTATTRAGARRATNPSSSACRPSAARCRASAPRVARDLAAAEPARPPTRAAVLATLVRLLDTTLVRIGNDEYARDNGSYGLTTLRNRHAGVRGDTLRLRFRGKSGVRARR